MINDKANDKHLHIMNTMFIDIMDSIKVDSSKNCIIIFIMLYFNKHFLDTTKTPKSTCEGLKEWANRCNGKYFSKKEITNSFHLLKLITILDKKHYPYTFFQFHYFQF